MVTDKTAKAQAKRLKGLRAVPDEGRDEVGKVMITADNDGHLTRAVEYILKSQDWYPTPRGMQEALHSVPKSLVDGCSLCQGRGLVFVARGTVGTMDFCQCSLGAAKREAANAGGRGN
jgi:hypothetical protein